MSVIIKKVDQIPWMLPPMKAKYVEYKVLIGTPDYPNVNFIMRMFKIAPNGEVPIHQHDWEHEIFVLKGKGKVIWRENNEKKEALLEEGMCCFIPPNIPHGFRNDEKEDWIFLCLIPKK